MSAPGTFRTRVRLTGLKGPGVYMDAFTQSLGTGTGLGQAYDAAGTARRASSWLASGAGPNSALAYSQPTLVRRSRDAVRQNGWADAAVGALETNIVGTGIKPQWMTPDPGLNRALAELWLDWTDEADADGRLDWYGLEAMAVRATVEAGEVFGRFRARRPGDMATVPLQIQLLESEYCPVEKNETIAGRQVRAGVEFDALGRRTAYWMYRQHPYDWSVNAGGLDGQPHPVPASEVMHIAQPRRPGMIRGEPWLTRALIKLHEIDEYDDAEVVRKKTAAMFAGFVELADNGNNPVPTDTTTDAAGTAEASLEPGIMQYLRPGESVKFSDPAEVGGSYESFMTQQMRAIARSAGVLYEQLTGDYSKINDRTYRASVNEFRRSVQMYQHHLAVFQLCRPTVMRWLDVALLARAIVPPRQVDARALRRVKWVPQGFSYIHPVQEVQAQRDAVRAGFKTRSEVVSEQGYDADAIDREQAEDNARADELGLRYESDGRQARSGSATAQTRAASETGGRDDDGAGDGAEQEERETEDA